MGNQRTSANASHSANNNIAALYHHNPGVGTCRCHVSDDQNGYGVALANEISDVARGLRSVDPLILELEPNTERITGVHRPAIFCCWASVPGSRSCQF